MKAMELDQAKKLVAQLDKPARLLLLEILCSVKDVTKVLGNGIGQISTPDGFFMDWNIEEVNISRMIMALREGTK